MSDDDDKQKTLDFLPNDFLTEYRGDEPISSSMYHSVFLLGNRIPVELIQQIRESSNEDIEGLLLLEKPLISTTIEKNYWKGDNRPYNQMIVDVYGSVCLVGDRHLLDVIISSGSIILDAHNYTLRQVAEFAGLNNVAWEYVMPSDQIDRPLMNRGVYYHISFNDICKALQLKRLKYNKDSIIERLRRLSIMAIKTTPVKAGKVLHESAKVFSFIDKEFFLLLNTTSVRNRNYNQETVTDLIVNVSEYYIDSLTTDGIIGRKRMKNHYPNLVGKNDIHDLYKFIDSHKRHYIHKKTFNEILDMYLDNKASLFGINRSHKKRSLIEILINDHKKLLDSFNLVIRKNNQGELALYHIEQLKKELEDEKALKQHMNERNLKGLFDDV